MKNINKDYIVDVNVKNCTVSTNSNLSFYITDVLTSNIFFRLIFNESSNPLIGSYGPNENAEDYSLTLRIAKPNRQPLEIDAQLLDQNSNLYYVDLASEHIDILGVYNCELFVNTTVNGRAERSTTNSFTYTVKPSIFSKLDDIIEGGPDYPLIDTLATKKYVDDAVAAGVGGDVLEGYATIEAMNTALANKADIGHTHDEYITTIPDEYITETELNNKNYATETYVDEAIAGVSAGDINLTNYVTKNTLNETLITYAPKKDPDFTGSISLGRYIASKIGDYSVAVGGTVTASGKYSHAEGTFTTASAFASHAEGDHTTASGLVSHTEGDNAIASGNVSHAEGIYTTAASACQHVQGKFNISDAEDKYAHIVGNGESTLERSNAHTLDWSGNAWFAGDVYTGGTGQSEGSKLATESYVDNAIPTSLPANGGNADTVGGYTIWSGTQTQFDAITTKDTSTVYIVKEG